MNYVLLSKEISYVLRHGADDYGLSMDEEGWIKVSDLLSVLRRKQQWENIELADLKIMIDKSKKKRHEIHNEKIRAYYGHSTKRKIKKNEIKPPNILYHGTTTKVLDKIFRDGIISNQRQYVHLSNDIETAKEVAKRHSNDYVVLKINANQAYLDGVKFYHGNEQTWLSDYIAPEYLTLD